MRHAGAHVRICDDATGLQPHAKPLKAEPSDVGAPAKAEEDFFGLDADLLPVMRESYFFLGRHATGVEQSRTGIKLDALAAKHGFQLAAGIEVEFMEDVRAALNHRHLDAEPGEELRKLDCDRAAAKHEQRLGEALQLERRVAIKTIQFINLGQGRWCYDGAGSDDEISGG